jgi:hypothetical protein
VYRDVGYVVSGEGRCYIRVRFDAAPPKTGCVIPSIRGPGSSRIPVIPEEALMIILQINYLSGRN